MKARPAGWSIWTSRSTRRWGGRIEIVALDLDRTSCFRNQPHAAGTGPVATGR